MAREIRWTSQPPGYIVQSFWQRSCQFSSKMNFKLFTDTFFVTLSESKISNCMVCKNLDRGKEFTWRLLTCPVHFITVESWSDSDWPMNMFKTTITAHTCGVEKGTKTLCQHGQVGAWSKRVHLAEPSHKTCKAYAKSQQDNQGCL